MEQYFQDQNATVMTIEQVRQLYPNFQISDDLGNENVYIMNTNGVDYQPHEGQVLIDSNTGQPIQLGYHHGNTQCQQSQIIAVVQQELTETCGPTMESMETQTIVPMQSHQIVYHQQEQLERLAQQQQHQLQQIQLDQQQRQQQILHEHQMQQQIEHDRLHQEQEQQRLQQEQQRLQQEQQRLQQEQQQQILQQEQQQRLQQQLHPEQQMQQQHLQIQEQQSLQHQQTLQQQLQHKMQEQIQQHINQEIRQNQQGQQQSQQEQQNMLQMQQQQKLQEQQKLQAQQKIQQMQQEQQKIAQLQQQHLQQGQQMIQQQFYSESNGYVTTNQETVQMRLESQSVNTMQEEVRSATFVPAGTQLLIPTTNVLSLPSGRKIPLRDWRKTTAVMSQPTNRVSTIQSTVNHVATLRLPVPSNQIATIQSPRNHISTIQAPANPMVANHISGASSVITNLRPGILHRPIQRPSYSYRSVNPTPRPPAAVPTSPTFVQDQGTSMNMMATPRRPNTLPVTKRTPAPKRGTGRGRYRCAPDAFTEHELQMEAERTAQYIMNTHRQSEAAKRAQQAPQMTSRPPQRSVIRHHPAMLHKPVDQRLVQRQMVRAPMPPAPLQREAESTNIMIILPNGHSLTVENPHGLSIPQVLKQIGITTENFQVMDSYEPPPPQGQPMLEDYAASQPIPEEHCLPQPTNEEYCSSQPIKEESPMKEEASQAQEMSVNGKDASEQANCQPDNVTTGQSSVFDVASISLGYLCAAEPKLMLETVITSAGKTTTLKKTDAVMGAGEDKMLLIPAATKPVIEALPVKKEYTPLLVPGMLAVCLACGYCSIDFNQCQRCRRALPVDCKRISSNAERRKPAQVVKEEAPPEVPVLPPTTSLIKTLPPVFVEVPAPRGRKPRAPARRTKTKQPDEPVLLTLSSDDEAAEAEPAPAPLLFNSPGFMPSGTSLVTNSVRRKEPPIKGAEGNCDLELCGGGLNTDIEKIMDGSDGGPFVVLECRTVRIGSYKVVPMDRVLITSKGIKMVVPHLEDETSRVNIILPTNEIEKVLMHFGKAMPVMFVYAKSCTGTRFRTQLRMTPENGHEYSPTGTEINRRITILPSRIPEETKVLMKNILPSGILSELSHAEANDILIRASPTHQTPNRGVILGVKPEKSKVRQCWAEIGRVKVVRELTKLLKRKLMKKKGKLNLKNNKESDKENKSEKKVKLKLMKKAGNGRVNKKRLKVNCMNKIELGKVAVKIEKKEEVKEENVGTEIKDVQKEKIVKIRRRKKEINIPLSDPRSPYCTRLSDRSGVLTTKKKQLAKVRGFTRILVYPPPPEMGGISINTEDYSCLGAMQFLNDVIIDFYLKYLTLSVLSPVDKKRTHIFSTFFYKRLTTRPKKNKKSTIEEDSKLTAAEKRHFRVKSWTKKVNIFEKDFIIIPINEHSHWFLAIICFPGLTGPVRVSDESPVAVETAPVVRRPIERPARAQVVKLEPGEIRPTSIQLEMMADSSDKDEADEEEEDLEQSDDDELAPAEASETSAEEAPAPPEVPAAQADSPSTPRKTRSRTQSQDPIKQPCILIFDSLAGTMRTRIVATLRDYLRIEYKAKMKLDREFNKDTIKGASPKVPQQNNFYDCGLYVLQYVESFFQTPIRDYRLPMRELLAWFDDEVVNQKRAYLDNLLRRLMQESNIDVDSLQLPTLTFHPIDGDTSEEQPEGEAVIHATEAVFMQETNANNFMEETDDPSSTLFSSVTTVEVPNEENHVVQQEQVHEEEEDDEIEDQLLFSKFPNLKRIVPNQDKINAKAKRIRSLRDVSE